MFKQAIIDGIVIWCIVWFVGSMVKFIERII
jgi:hypothetical protein